MDNPQSHVILGLRPSSDPLSPPSNYEESSSTSQPIPKIRLTLSIALPITFPSQSIPLYLDALTKLIAGGERPIVALPAIYSNHFPASVLSWQIESISTSEEPQSSGPSIKPTSHPSKESEISEQRVSSEHSQSAIQFQKPRPGEVQFPMRELR